MKILVVEDDKLIGESIKEYMELKGAKVDYFSDPQQALESVSPTYYDILLLDINMPQIDGYQFYEQFKLYHRKRGEIPVIFITAYSDIEHIEKAFNMGASDYIKKPFQLKELELRIKRLVFNKTQKIEITPNYWFDVENGQLFYKEKEVPLTPNERSFLEILVKNLGKVVEVEKIKDYVWEGKPVCDNTLRTQVRKLRNKLKENFIVNVRGSGYKIEKKA
ncbi:MAG: DNA-binding response regulator [Epsilonproteobacteria bacterium]|jgi:DNA-binding response OmpR family regulator|nr:DNA-binding response regulator [Campylobacterota bacterium]NPA89014.1 response regulator transcription factor [Campylobacterota bacterium]